MVAAISDKVSTLACELVPGAGTLRAAEDLSSAGFACLWLKPQMKEPVEKGWSVAPVATFKHLRASHRTDNNLGVRLGEPSRVAGGYVHVIDLDIRIPDLAEEAWDRLRKLLPNVEIDALPCVQSGSGGESRHLYIICEKPFRSKVIARSDEKIRMRKGDKDVWSSTWEIELLGTGKQVVAAPSIHPDTGNAYKWQREFDLDLLSIGIGPFVAAADLDALSVGEHTPYAFEAVPPADLAPGQLEETLAAIDPSDLHYDDWLGVGQALKHQLGEAGWEHWLRFSIRSKKHDRKGEGVMRKKWRSFAQYRGAPLSFRKLLDWVNQAEDRNRTSKMRALFDPLDDATQAPTHEVPSDDFDALLGGAAESNDTRAADLALLGGGSSNDDNDDQDWVDLLNGQHAIARVQGKTVVLHEGVDGRVAYGSAADLHLLYENQRAKLPNGKNTEPVSKAWMRHPRRRTFRNGIVFSPSGDAPGTYNLWKGFSVEPDPGATCVLFLDHLRSVICSGDDATYQWVVRWFAHMIQRPWEKPGTALILRGRKGTGKDTVGNYVGGLFPRHHTKISQAEHLYGRFNAHQEQTLMLHVEEGFWAGDKKAEGSLKHVITSEQVQIEPKGVNAFQVASVLRVFVSSNEDWVVPASFDERRFCVLNVSAHTAQNNAYFTSLNGEMENGGRAALLHHLQSLDLSGFDVRNPPATEGLRDQKLQSLYGVSKWWFELLSTGDLPGVTSGFDDENGGGWRGGAVTSSRASLRAHYSNWVRDDRYSGKPMGSEEFGKKLRLICPGLLIARPRIGGGQVWCYTIPRLDDCRRDFAAALGFNVPWDSD